MKWAQVTVTISQEASEAVANRLFDLNALGVEIRDTQPPTSSSATLVTYFPMNDLVGDRLQKVQQFLDQLPAWGIPAGRSSVSLKAIQEADWAEEWRSSFSPQKIGDCIVVAPTWIEIVPKPSEVLIRLDPGMAFGTGQHPTTRLSIRLLEKTIKGNEILADIGTGSGILSIAAAKLGARQIDAVDLDESTLPVASKNFQLNDVASVVRLQAGNGLDACNGKYDIIIANILTKVLLPMIPELPQSLNVGGAVILSGIMTHELAQVVKALRLQQLSPINIEQDEEWVGISAKLSGSSPQQNL